MINRDMLDQSGLDSGLDQWHRYRDVDLKKTLETETQVYTKILYGFDTISW